MTSNLSFVKWPELQLAQIVFSKTVLLIQENILGTLIMVITAIEKKQPQKIFYKKKTFFQNFLKIIKSEQNSKFSQNAGNSFYSQIWPGMCSPSPKQHPKYHQQGLQGNFGLQKFSTKPTIENFFLNKVFLNKMSKNCPKAWYFKMAGNVIGQHFFLYKSSPNPGEHHRNPHCGHEYHRSFPGKQKSPLEKNFSKKKNFSPKFSTK